MWGSGSVAPLINILGMKWSGRLVSASGHFIQGKSPSNSQDKKMAGHKSGLNVLEIKQIYCPVQNWTKGLRISFHYRDWVYVRVCVTCVCVWYVCDTCVYVCVTCVWYMCVLVCMTCFCACVCVCVICVWHVWVFVCDTCVCVYDMFLWMCVWYVCDTCEYVCVTRVCVCVCVCV